MAKPKTELGKLHPPPPYTRWDQRRKPVLLCHLKKLANGKSLCLSLQTQDVLVAKRFMRLLVAWLVAKGRLAPHHGSAKVYAPKRTVRARLKQVDTEICRLRATSDAKYRSETLVAAKRLGLPIGIIHHMVGSKPEIAAGTIRTRRMRARERDRQLPMGLTWEHRAQGGKGFFWNHGVPTARQQIDGRTWQWPLKVNSEEQARVLMERIRVARKRLHLARREQLNFEKGTTEALAATAAVFAARAELASAIKSAGGPKKLIDVIVIGPQEAVVPAVAQPVRTVRNQHRKHKKGAWEKCVRRYIELIRAYPGGAPEPRDVLEKKMMNEFGVTLREARDCRAEAIKRTGNLTWSLHGRPRLIDGKNQGTKQGKIQVNKSA